MYVKISRWQFFLLTVNYILGTSYFVIFQGLIKQGKQDAWLIPWWAGAFGIAVAFLWILLQRLYPGKSMAQIPISVLGRPLGIVISILYFLFFCILAGWVLRNLSDFLNATIMPESPMSVFHVMFLIVAVYTVLQGVETIARLNQFVTPFLFFPFWLVLLVAVSDWQWYRFQPAFQTDILSTVINTNSFLGFPYMESLALMMFFPYVKDGVKKTFFGGIVAASLSMSLTLFMTIGILGVERASRLTYPIYSLVQEVSIGEELVHIHSIISVVLLILIFIKVLVLVFCAHESLDQLFRPKTKWPVILALLVFLSALGSSIYENPIQNKEWDAKYTFLYDFFFAVFLPGLLLVTTWIKKTFKKRDGVSAG